MIPTTQIISKNVFDMDVIVTIPKHSTSYTKSQDIHDYYVNESLKYTDDDEIDVDNIRIMYGNHSYDITRCNDTQIGTLTFLRAEDITFIDKYNIQVKCRHLDTDEITIHELPNFPISSCMNKLESAVIDKLYEVIENKLILQNTLEFKPYERYRDHVIVAYVDCQPRMSVKSARKLYN